MRRDRRKQKHLSGLASLSPESKARERERERERKFYILAAQTRENSTYATALRYCLGVWPAWTSSKAIPAPFTETVLRISYAPILQPFRFRFPKLLSICIMPGTAPCVAESRFGTSFDLFHTAWPPATAVLCNVRRAFIDFVLGNLQICRNVRYVACLCSLALQMDYV